MENLLIDSTKDTPKIDFNFENGLLNFSGKSYPENTFNFYKPIIKWLQDYVADNNNEKTTVKIDIEYLNSSSLKTYFEILDIFEVAHNRGKNVEIYWIYDEDNDIAQEIGEDFLEDFKSLSITLVQK